MDWVICHGEIPHAYPHAIPEAHHERVDAGEHAAVPRPHVEVRHLRDLRQVGAWVDEVRAHDENEVAVNAIWVSAARVDDEHPHHAHCHLHHLVGVRVIHERPTLL